MSKEDLLDKFYASVPSFVFDRSYIHSAQGYAFFLDIMDEYAKECVQRSLAKAASNAKIISNTCIESNMGFSPCCNVKVDGNSICNDKNEVYAFNSENKYERAINKILDMKQSKSIGDLHVGDKIIDGEIAVKMFNDALELIKYIIRKELKDEKT